MMETLPHELSCAARTLAAARLFTITVVARLSLGIGPALFVVVNRVPDADRGRARRMVRIVTHDSARGLPRAMLPYGECRAPAPILALPVE